ncbi:hypothetical protein C8J57DRAFT_1478265 [Mycena rebaudengoi]|nr:hypothetical protein C8J57DRAFT_1478265 [Mycena rebaudengoi]
MTKIQVEDMALVEWYMPRDFRQDGQGQKQEEEMPKMADEEQTSGPNIKVTIYREKQEMGKKEKRRRRRRRMYYRGGPVEEHTGTVPTYTCLYSKYKEIVSQPSNADRKEIVVILSNAGPFIYSVVAPACLASEAYARIT